MSVSIMINDGMPLLRCRGSDRYATRVLLKLPKGERVIELRFDPETLDEFTVVDVNGGPEIEDE